jgi:hypothetical protein
MMQLAGKGYTCGQIIVKLGLEARGETNPGLVRAMAGLAYGCGFGRGTCGALTGGGCLLALYANGNDDSETVSEPFPVMQQALTDWFEERLGLGPGGTACDAIVGEAGVTAARQRCGGLVADTYARVLVILEENGIDPSGRDIP